MPELKELGCRSCVGGGGACCRVFTCIYLTEAELNELEDKGAILREIDREGLDGTSLGRAALEVFFAQTPEGKKPYRFLKDCPNLIENKEEGWATCAVYDADTPIRPEACGQFRVGSAACHEAQEAWMEWQGLTPATE